MKRGVKARHLGQFGMAPRNRLNQPDLSRQVIGVIRHDAVQFREQLRCDPLRFRMLHSLHYTVSCSADRREDRLRLKPVQQKTHRRAVVGGSEAAGRLRFSSRILDDQSRAAQTDAIDLSVETPPRRFSCLIDREPDTRRAAVDREDAGHSRFHTYLLRLLCLSWLYALTIFFEM